MKPLDEHDRNAIANKIAFAAAEVGQLMREVKALRERVQAKEVQIGQYMRLASEMHEMLRRDEQEQEQKEQLQ